MRNRQIRAVKVKDMILLFKDDVRKNIEKRVPDYYTTTDPEYIWSKLKLVLAEPWLARMVRIDREIEDTELFRNTVMLLIWKYLNVSTNLTPHDVELRLRKEHKSLFVLPVEGDAYPDEDCAVFTCCVFLIANPSKHILYDFKGNETKSKTQLEVYTGFEIGVGSHRKYGKRKNLEMLKKAGVVMTKCGK